MRYYLVVFIVVMCVPVLSRAAVKCVALDNNTECTLDSARGSEWVVKCDGGIMVRGIAMCSEPDTLEDSVSCYCRMIIPVVSNWKIGVAGGYLGHSGGPAPCVEDCAMQCAEKFIRSESFDLRQEMLSNPLG